MALLGETAIAVTRYAAGEWQGGYFQDGATTALSLMASVQPIRGRELLNLPEAQRTREPIWMFTETAALRTADETAETRADVVTWKGRDYEIQAVEDWTDHKPAHWKCLALLVEQTPVEE